MKLIILQSSPAFRHFLLRSKYSPPRYECVELYLHSPETLSWRGNYLSTETTLPFTLFSNTLNLYFRFSVTDQVPDPCKQSK
jgi:hypothetical protein